ncbi:hypothetical protein H7F37_12015 [Winogradskyella sp. PAMC22761]|nr:hypothetical protein H7F37_12015 [Winogradskyella sp. PAMC22761]
MKHTAIITEISTVTRDIEENYPELQKYLGETRSTLPEGDNSDGSLNNEDLENYLNELKTMLEEYKKEH